MFDFNTPAFDALISACSFADGTCQLTRCGTGITFTEYPGTSKACDVTVVLLAALEREENALEISCMLSDYVLARTCIDCKCIASPSELQLVGHTSHPAYADLYPKDMLCPDCDHGRLDDYEYAKNPSKYYGVCNADFL